MSHHTLKTRLLHSIIALLIIVQLATIFFIDNQFFSKSISTNLFAIHKYSGITSFVILFLFWVTLFKRHQGTSVQKLFPWFSLSALKNFKDAFTQSLSLAWQRKMPNHAITSPLSSAFHGLGIIIMSIMATTGVFRFIVYEYAITKTPLVEFIRSLHHVFGDYAWIYLGIHAAMALINHITRTQKLSDMWSFKK
ncbi:MAG: cytochrome b561 [Dasania sp.]|jgi:cytochrome b561